MCFLKLLRRVYLQQKQMLLSVLSGGRAAVPMGRRRQRFTCTKVHRWPVRRKRLDVIRRNKTAGASHTNFMELTVMKIACCPFKGSFFSSACLRGPPAYDFEWSNLADERVAIVRGIIRLSLLR